MKHKKAYRSEVQKWVEEILTRLNYAHLIPEVKVRWSRMSDNVGLSLWDECYNIKTKKFLYIKNMKIVFSGVLWPMLSEEERYETVAHECCHLVDAIESEGLDVDDPHGDNWLRLMKSLGCKGTEVMSVADLKISFCTSDDPEPKSKLEAEKLLIDRFNEKFKLNTKKKNKNTRKNKGAA